MDINTSIVYGVMGLMVSAYVFTLAYFSTEKIPEGDSHPPVTIAFESIGALGMIGSIIFLIARVVKELIVA